MNIRDGAWAILGVVRGLGVGLLAGAGAGLLAGGLGSRLAMRISAFATGDSCSGLVTENGNRCGDITLDGTIFLILFGGMIFGVIGGVIYVAVSSSLAGLGRWRGLAFGLLLLAIFGSMVIESNNQDFRRFAHPAVNITLFALLFPAFGLTVAPLAGWLDRAMPLSQLRRPVRTRRSFATCFLIVAGLWSAPFLIAPAVETLVEGQPKDIVLVSLIYYLLLLVPPVPAILRRITMGGCSVSGGPTQLPLFVLGHVVLGVPLLAGLALTIVVISEIMR